MELNKLNHGDCLEAMRKMPDKYFELAIVDPPYGGGAEEDLSDSSQSKIRSAVVSEVAMAMCEYAWTSFNDNAKLIELAPQGNAQDPRFHPTQKPVALYSWLLNNYAKQGDKILDTHAGSASSLIACHKAGFDYVGFELDEHYHKLATERLDKLKQQITIFDLKENNTRG